MKLERVTLGSTPTKPDPEKVLPGRLPRWTRQEILVLIEGKRVAENRVGSGQAAESKWATVSGYCKRHGVDRRPVQCRKRWSNLAGDYKKIKEWESQQGSETEHESYWAMRSDVRREKKLPGFFDKEVYDILEASTTTSIASPTPVGLLSALGHCPSEADDVAEAEEEEEEPMPPTRDIPAPIPISEQEYQPFTNGRSSEGPTVGKQDNFNPETGDTSNERRKRKRSSLHGDEENSNALQNHLIGVLEKNGEIMSTYLETQMKNSQLDRDQRKDHMDSFVAVLGKLADALGKIADKL